MDFPNRLADIDKLQQEILSHRPLRREMLRQLKEYFRIGLTWSSNALEGNTLTETETKVVIEEGITVSGKPLKDHLEAIGHAEAFDYLYRLAKKQDVGENDILKLHRLFYLRIDPSAAGRYRKENVIVTGTDFIFPSPSEVKELMAAFAAELPTLRGTLHPVAYAATLHARLVTIHPFVDGNGRAARLIMNLALLQAGFPITMIPPVLRPQYLETVRKSNFGDMGMFIDFVSSMVWESQRDYLRLVQSLERV